MSTVSGLDSNSYAYAPTLNTDNSTSTPVQDASTTLNSSTTDPTISSQLDQLNQGILSDTYTPQSSSSTSSSASDSYSSILKNNPLLSSTVLNFSTEQTLLQGMTTSSTTSDPLIALSSQLNLLNSGIDVSKIAGLTSQSSASPDMAALGTELKQLDSGANPDTQATAATQTPVLNYNFSPTTGITTNTTNTNNNSTGSNIDLQV